MILSNCRFVPSVVAPIDVPGVSAWRIIVRTAAMRARCRACTADDCRAAFIERCDACGQVLPNAVPMHIELRPFGAALKSLDAISNKIAKIMSFQGKYFLIRWTASAVALRY
jgi:hypothetical protein